MSKRPRILVIIVGALIIALPCGAQQLINDDLSVTVNAQDGSYQMAMHDRQPVLNTHVGAQVGHQWLHSSDRLGKP